MDFAYIGMVLLLIFGFGFVIFWHELGHFLAAKWAGVKVEQFAVGFGQAMLSWRKGLGLRWGSSRQEFEKELRDYLRSQETAESSRQALEEMSSDERRLDYASERLGISETEYRLNWIPLGGYVKMLGQDDMNPNALSDSPRSYNNKPIGKRMVIVSAGVIMNVILAVILFTVLFRIGFDVPPAVAGYVVPRSPAQQAGIQVGDRILTFDGRFQHDFTKISLNTALVEEGTPVPVEVKRPDGSIVQLKVTPRRSDADSSGFLQLGIGQSPQLRGLDPKKVGQITAEDQAVLNQSPVLPGETVVAIEGKPITDKQLADYYLLDRALQAGSPVNITVLTPEGKREDRIVQPHFIEPFGAAPLDFAGLVPRVLILSVLPNSPAKEKLKSGDVVLEVTVQGTNDTLTNPSRNALMKVLGNAGEHDQKITMLVLRDGKPTKITDLDPTVTLDRSKNRKGLGVGLRVDEEHPVVAAVLPDSPAATALIPAGSAITSIADQKVGNWFDVQRVLASIVAGKEVPISFTTPDGQTKAASLKLSEDQLALVRSNRYTTEAALDELHEPRKTTNPITAAQWGLTETRDLMVQFYLTIRRMIQGSVPTSGAMGPIGIFHQGSKIANRGVDWLIWFLAMISANLAVVNFLPIPIVDGGLFVFLILEKIMRKPLSARAQSIAQIVGLALIASVFLFVTYHDIMRMF